MKWDLKRHLFALAMVAVTLAAAMYYSPVLPDSVPSHFNTEGIADHWSPKSLVIAFCILAPLGIFALLTFVPLIDPFWKRIQGKYNLFLVFRDIAMGSMVYFSIVVYISAVEGTYASNLSGFGFGLMFVLFGNYLPRLPRNFFFGIRSPWTLASEEVWKRTHRVSGWLFVIAGLVIAILSFTRIPQHLVLLVVLSPVVLFSALIYPYVLHRKLEHEAAARIPQL
jgi:uncharacterized membrane protein